jgi:hypothetical protein
MNRIRAIYVTHRNNPIDSMDFWETTMEVHEDSQSLEFMLECEEGGKLINDPGKAIQCAIVFYNKSIELIQKLDMGQDSGKTVTKYKKALQYLADLSKMKCQVPYTESVEQVKVCEMGDGESSFGMWINEPCEGEKKLMEAIFPKKKLPSESEEV